MTLAPWDWLPYFDLPTEVHILQSASVVQTLLTANPHRVIGVIGCNGTAGQVAVSTLSTSGGGVGVPVSATTGPLILTPDVWGPLVSSQWFLPPGSTGLTITVIEVQAHRWPHADWTTLKRGLQNVLSRFGRNVRPTITPGKPPPHWFNPLISG